LFDDIQVTNILQCETRDEEEIWPVNPFGDCSHEEIGEGIAAERSGAI
jgi:hypothetical protein